MHHDGIRFGEREFFRRQAEELEVFLRGRQPRALHALVLQAQHDDDIAAGEAGFHVVEHLDAHLLDPGGQQGLRADHAHFRHAQRGQRVDLRARHPRMQHVADDGHREIVKLALVAADGEHVEQALRRVRVAAVAGVDHRNVRRDVARDEVRRARLRVAHDEHVGVHRGEVVDGVEDRLALGLAGGGDVEVDHIGGQALGGDLEGGAGARRRLEEQVEDRFAAQQRDFFHLALADVHEGFGGVENLRQDGARQAVEREQVAQPAVFSEL